MRSVAFLSLQLTERELREIEANEELAKTLADPFNKLYEGDKSAEEEIRQTIKENGKIGVEGE